MTPFPGLDHSGPGVGWGIFPLPREQEEETRGHTPSRPAASFALRPAALSLGLLPHVHGPHPAQLLGSPDFLGVCSLPEDWLLCLPGPQACLGDGSHAACCVPWGGHASCASVPQAGELTPVLPPTLTGASLCRTLSWVPAPPNPRGPHFCPGSQSAGLMSWSWWPGSCRPCRRSCRQLQRPGGRPGRPG